MTDKIEQIKELIKSTPEGNIGDLCGNVLELDAQNGIGFSFGLWKKPDIAVARTVMSKGAVFTPHHHKELETIQVYKGEFHLFIGVKTIEECKEGEKIILKAGDIYQIKPNVSHAVIVVEDTYCIVTTIPASRFFPDADK